ncbi:MAG: hypothetical protein H6996_11645 [Moraxellaceae bacterium]|nr:hypothetical protein [Moraxellaceae bacterium]MCP5176984.1 hypothetical protein [Moraxellaceae bacterium]
MSQVRGVIPLFVVSYLIHAMLLVNSAETELNNHQRPTGELLSEQLAVSAAPFIINKDSVGLGLLANHFGEAGAVLNLRILDNQGQVLATGGQAQSQKGLNFSAPIILEKQRLGQAHIALSTPERGDIIKNSSINLALSFLAHLFLMLWVGWPQLFKNMRVPILQATNNEEAIAEPIPSTPEPTPEPVKPAASIWVNICFDDPKGLMSKVNANTSAQFLQVIDKLIKRCTRLYTGKAVSALSTEGMTIRFDGDNIEDCTHRAVLSSRLLIKLTTTAHSQRREARQFTLKLKAAMINLADLKDEEALKQLKTLLPVTKVNQIMIADDDAMAAELSKHQLSTFEAEEDSPEAHKKIKAKILETLTSELEDELSLLEQRILERKKSEAKNV